MKRLPRITFEVLFPPALAAGIFIVAFAVENGGVPIQGILTVLGVSYACAILPSLAYAGLMEKAFTGGLSPSSWRSVGLSSLLGIMAGAVIGAFLARGLAALLIMMLVGLFAGSVSGLIIKAWAHRFSSKV